ncbi:unnamed protein product [Rotaria sp. Silwood1]|nr:unnamed protein product [Rotaria sp. Silwood1]
MGTTVTSGYDKQKHDKFMEKVQSETSTRLGGDPSIKDLNAWAKTVSDNPVVSKFSMKFIVDLLNTQRFPSDTHIADKAKLIKTVLDEYMNQPVYCYNNCTNSTYGTCIPTGIFNVGKCQCKSGFEGVDCSSDSVPQGTLCGVFSQTGSSSSTVTCGGHKPQESCPQGYNQYVGLSSTVSLFAFCYKAQMDNIGEPTKGGAWCGDSLSNIPCGSVQAPAKGCPIGYIKFSNWRRCYKQVDSLVDLWGTLCGFDTAGYIPRIQVPCGGMYASMNKCPANFQLSSATLGRCYKI